ncbi:FxSxx-COOH system tetratricopeptide repeat protein [Actinoallomurus acaciae]|uniref:FxSxx-COOH system tetratricopeptide repeat protein n=1 Tax=Actinoallomurus acaciae TaxID=502577 RepID=A0ABV5YCM0_9ACTN
MGDQIITQVNLPEQALRPVDQVTAPPSLANVSGHSHVFVGRENELADLEASLTTTGGVVVAAVHGLGGVGKSTLAARYAATEAGRLNPVWWITADTAQSVQAGLADLAVGLQSELAVGLPLEMLAQRATRWLAAHERWLVVLDNVTDPADVAPLLNQTLTGRIVVTTRLAEGWHRYGARVLRLDVLTESQAVDLLTGIAAQGQPDADLDGAAALVRELGFLPLAVEQAAAYLHQNQISPCAYLDLLAQYPAAMYDEAARGSDAKRTIARIWRLTLNQLTDLPLAGVILQTLAWYGPEEIPRSLLNGIFKPPQIQSALGALAAYNMIALDGEAITIHRLVQAVARTPDPSDPYRHADDINNARELATSLLVAALPDDYQDPAKWPAWRSLLPHINALLANASPDTDSAETGHLLNQAGLFLGSQGRSDDAIAFFERAIAVDKRVRDDDDPEIFTPQHNLAVAYSDVGDLEKAIPLLERILVDRKRILGVDHIDTMTTQNNLGSAYQEAGDLLRAVRLLKQTLTDRERVLDSDHPHTLSSRNNLANAYLAAENFARAIPLFERAVADHERVLGSRHPYTLAVRSNLAGAYQGAGDPDRAVAILEQIFADSEEIFGDESLETLRARNNLAGACLEAGGLERAIKLFERTVADSDRIRGKGHPNTIASKHSLARAYRDAGKFRQSIAMLEQVISGWKDLVGADDPRTITARHNLAHAYQFAGDFRWAAQLHREILPDCRRVLGPDNLVTMCAATWRG